MSKGVISMAISLDDVRIEFEELNENLDFAIREWLGFQRPILTNFETTKRMFAPNSEWEWVQDAYFEWENLIIGELNRIATGYGFKLIDNIGVDGTVTFKYEDSETLIDKSLGELRRYYHYDFDGGNRLVKQLLENVATIKFSLTKDDTHGDGVLKATYDLCRNARLNIEHVFRNFEMVMVHRDCKQLLDGNIKHCAADMRPIYQHDFEFIMSEVESFKKYDGSADMVRKIMDKTYNGNFDFWYDHTVACHGSVDVIHDMEIEMQNLASDLGLDVWFI